MLYQRLVLYWGTSHLSIAQNLEAFMDARPARTRCAIAP
jgi:hypothetical protein